MYSGSVVQWQNSQADQSQDPICGDLILAILLMLTARALLALTLLYCNTNNRFLAIKRD